MKIRISEQFETIQGEGLYAGIPSLFIRTSSCNLRCAWCDTPYTSWKPEGGFREAGELIAEAKASKCQHVVITGGEPMLYAEALVDVVKELRGAGKVVTIETNGTIHIPEVSPNLWSVSPKLANSVPSGPGQDAERELHLRNITCAPLARFCMDPAVQVQFKFVLSEPRDCDEIVGLCKRWDIPPWLIWAMPEGRTRDEVLTKAVWLAEECKSRGWNLCLRQHVLIWGNKRGV